MIRCQFEDGANAHLRHVVVDVVLLNADRDAVLLVRRAPRLIEGGKLAVVGGYVDLDESCAQAAAREVLEETGYQLTDLQLLVILDGPRKNNKRQNIAFVYTAIATKQIGQPDNESTEQLWVPLEKLPPESDFAFDHYTHIMRYLDSRKKGSQ